VTDIALPPLPVDPGPTATAEQRRAYLDAYNYAVALIDTRAREVSLEAERASLQAWRTADIEIRRQCQLTAAAAQSAIAPTVDVLAEAWDALDLRLADVAAALRGEAKPTPAPPPPFPVPL
jgi:hypothetical protein